MKKLKKPPDWFSLPISLPKLIDSCTSLPCYLTIPKLRCTCLQLILTFNWVYLFSRLSLDLSINPSLCWRSCEDYPPSTTKSSVLMAYLPHSNSIGEISLVANLSLTPLLSNGIYLHCILDLRSPATIPDCPVVFLLLVLWHASLWSHRWICYFSGDGSPVTPKVSDINDGFDCPH